MSRVFLSHSSRDKREAIALKAWLIQAEPGLADEIFLDLDRQTGIPAGVRWKEALRRANERCEAVICLLSDNWDASDECKVEYRHAEDLNKPIFAVRLQPLTGRDITSEWQRCDLFGDGPKTSILVDGDGRPVEFLTEGLLRLRDGLRTAGIAADTFAWPPADDPDRAPYRGWQPLEAVDAAVYFGRDAQIGRALNVIRGLRSAGGGHLFVILGPSGVGKSSFLRAGLLPRLGRDDRHFLPMGIVRPQRNALAGDGGLAQSIHELRIGLGLRDPGLGEIKSGIRDIAQVRGWLTDAQRAAQDRIIDPADSTPPTLVLPIDQAEELFGVDAGEQAGGLLDVVAALLDPDESLALIAIATIRSDRYEPLQTAPQLATLQVRPFDDLKPMPLAQFKEVICGPARRAREAGSRLTIAPELVDRLLEDWSRGADTLPLLSLTLARLYQDYGHGEITLAEYTAMGGLRHIVQNEVDELLAADPAVRQAQLEVLRSAFIPWLATINPDNDQPMRRVARWSDLPPDSHPLLEEFVARRLLVRDERDGVTVVEVALESLLRQWDALAGWLRAEAADLKDTDAIEQAVRAWEQNARQEDWLLEGTRLAEAEALAAKPGFRERLNTAREFLLASRQREDLRARERQEATEAVAAAEERAKVEAQNHARVLLRRTRVLRAALALVAVVALIAVGGGIWAWNAQQNADARARDATAMRLDAESQMMLTGQHPQDNDDVLAMQMLLAARSIPSRHHGENYPLLTALHQKRDLLKVIDVPTFVNSVTFSPDGRRIVAGGYDDTVRQWDSQTGQPIGEPLRANDNAVMGINGVESVALSPDGRKLASGSIDGTFRLWNAATGKPIGEPRRGHYVVSCVAFSPDGSRIASASMDGTVRLWDAATEQLIWELRSHDNAVTSVTGLDNAVMSVSFSPDGQRLASASLDDTIRLWDTATGQPIGGPLRGHDNGVRAADTGVAVVAFSPDGRRLAWANGDKTIRLWDAATGQPIGEPLRGHDHGVTSVAFSPDGRRLASASADKTIRLWDAATGRPIGVLSGHRAAVDKVAFSPDSLHVVSSGDDNTVRVWDATSWQPMVGHDGGVQAEFRDNGRRIASGSQDATARSWDTATGQPIGEPLRVADDDVHMLLSTKDGRLVSFGSVNTVRLWDAETRQPISEPLRLPPNPLLHATYNTVAHVIAAQTEPGTIQLWNADTMRLVGQPIRQDQPVQTITFSDDGRILATGSSGGAVRLWDTTTGAPVGAPMTGNAWIDHITFSADGHMLAAADSNNGLHLWKTQTSQPVGNAMHVDSMVTALAFSPDGHTLASGSMDGTIGLFDAGDQTQLGAALTGHSANIISLDFSPDGTRLLSASADHTLRVWPVPTPSPEALCAKLTHNMSRQQWNSRVSPDIDYIEVCPGLPIAGD